MSSQFLEMAKLATEMITPRELAESAADGKGRGECFEMVVRDKNQPEIVVGHMLVVVLYGAEERMQTAKSALLEVSTIITERIVDLDGGEPR